MNNPYQKLNPYGTSSPQGIYANVPGQGQGMGVPSFQGGSTLQTGFAPQTGFTPQGGGQGAYPSAPSGGVAPGGAAQLPEEQSYIENILRLNLGKTATLYMTYENNTQWNAKIFNGKLEAAGRDHIIISDPTTGLRILLLMVNLDYATFDQPLQYTYPYR